MATFRVRRTHFPDKILLVPPAIRTERLETCKQCQFYRNDNQNCTINDKFMPTHVNARATQCPLGVWSTYYGR